MEKIVLDEHFRGRLNDTNRELELVDDQGQTLGYFLPASVRDRLRNLEAENERLLIEWGFRQLTAEQLNSDGPTGKVYTTADVIKHLEGL